MRSVRCGVVWLVVFSFGLASTGYADTVSETDSYSAGVTTRFPLPFPSGTVATTFTSYTGTGFPYILGTFYVGTTGSFSGTVSGIGGGVALYIVRGTYSPSSAMDPTTLLTDVLAGTQAPAMIPSVALTAD